MPILYYNEMHPEFPFERKTPGASGFDLHANILRAPQGAEEDDERFERQIKIGERWKIPTGIYLAMPLGVEAQVRPRSGLALNHGLTVLNTPGTIDADYRNEICVILANINSIQPFRVKRGDRIAQLVFCPVIIPGVVRDVNLYVEIERVDSLDKLPPSERGTSGFGSTGV